MRYFNNRKIELLAPAGNFDIFKDVVDSKCDAIYFGGTQMNMRMIRKGYNFSDDELKEAVLLAGEKGKATYITVNNLLDHQEVAQADAYLKYLESINPTGLIVQDFAVLKRVKALGLNLDLHASVMMNVHNLPMIHALKAQGFTRVVLSRETTLADVRDFHAQTDMEFEYFTHGDMCVAHGAQCYYSAMLFGMSSNRGKCLKPCRWWFDIEEKQTFPLAVKDLSMIAHLPQMIHAGITSFKIEGRMREKEFITALINHYGDVTDRYIEDPLAFDTYEEAEWIHENRKRDLSTAYAFGNPGIANINTRYEGTGKFYSTGKMFSQPTPEQPVTESQIELVTSAFSSVESQTPQLSVRVDDMAQAEACIEMGVDRIYLAADVFLPKAPFSIASIIELSKKKGKTELFVSTPRMMDALQLEQYKVWMEKIEPYVDGMLLTNLGAIEWFKAVNLKKVGDFTLNIFNAEAAAFYMEQGLEWVTPSIELPKEALGTLLEVPLAFEVITHGQLSTMYMSYDLYQAYDHSTDTDLILENEAGIYTVKKDVFGKCHLLMQRPYSLLPVVHKLRAASVRIEAQMMDVSTLKDVIEMHQRTLSGAFETIKPAFLDKQYTFGATRF